MSEPKEPKVRTDAQPPEALRQPKVGPRPAAAGGWGALAATAKHGLSEMGLLRTTRTLLQLNQEDGFDCPGCAWPDPDDRAALTEFCENGAKAAAWETTRQRLDWKFFQRYSIDDLARKSDYWLGMQGRLTEP